MRDEADRELTVFKTPSKCKQSFRESCDINRIVARALSGKAVEYFNKRPAGYADVSDVPDYRTALDRVIEARKVFDGLPAVVRKRFGNDPEEMVQFVRDEKNREEAEKLGLLKAKAESKVSGSGSEPSPSPSVPANPKPPAVGG